MKFCFPFINLWQVIISSLNVIFLMWNPLADFPPRLWIGSRLKSQAATLFGFMENWRPYFFFFCLKSCLFTFSCLNLMYLIIKLQKQDICIFKMVHDAENVTSNIAKCPLFPVLKFLSNCSFKVKSKASYFPRFPPRLWSGSGL